MMISEEEIIHRAAQRLEALLRTKAAKVQSHPKCGTHHADALMHIGSHQFLLEVKSDSNIARVANGIDQLRQASQFLPGAIPLLVVPYMMETGRLKCEQAGVNWLDLSGNAVIHAPSLLVYVEGKKNKFKTRGRPSSPFAPKSSRVARWLLLHHDENFNQRQLANEIGVHEATVSKIIHRLSELGLVTRQEDGILRVVKFDLLLDAWREDYDFDKHMRITGHVPARSGDEAIKLIAKAAGNYGIQHAATGLAAAWQMTHFVNFRLATIYFESYPPQELLSDIGFRGTSKGANVWIAVANDEGIFYGADDFEGVKCVHPIQAYLDLKEHPERAEEAAESLRNDILKELLYD